MNIRSHRRSCRGITLLELVTVMAIIGIIMTIAVPSYRNVTQGNRIAAEVNGLLGDMQYARAEAIKEGQAVSVCASSSGSGCIGPTATTWETGWIVFSDVNGNGIFGAGDLILRVQGPFTSTDTLRSNNNLGYVTFNREGFATGAGIATGALITLHATPVSNASTRCLQLTLVGLMTVQTANQSNNGVTCL